MGNNHRLLLFCATAVFCHILNRAIHSLERMDKNRDLNTPSYIMLLAAISCVIMQRFPSANNQVSDKAKQPETWVAQVSSEQEKPRLEAYSFYEADLRKILGEEKYAIMKDDLGVIYNYSFSKQMNPWNTNPIQLNHAKLALERLSGQLPEKEGEAVLQMLNANSLAPLLFGYGK